MARLRRFRVESLQGLKPGDTVALSPAEARHSRVLRLAAGAEIALFDRTGRSALARLSETPQGAGAELLSLDAPAETSCSLILATAWPKGKRAALLVEKCSELDVSRIIPVRYARGVVCKAEDSESLARLRRIAAAAAKQCGRSDEPEIATECSFGELLAEEAPSAFSILLDARAGLGLSEALQDERALLRVRPLLLIVGPEGGLAPEESAAADAAGIPRVRLARHVLRVETAALAACAIAGAALH